MTRNEILKTAKPILFNTEMVKAILDGRKTVTRRVIKSPAEVHECSDGIFVTRPRNYPDEYCRFVPYCPIKIGDILYVRETWQYAYDMDGNDQIIEGTGRYLYAADSSCPFNEWIMPDGTHRDIMPWRPSIHMPKEAARIFLRVTGVRVEKLQDITEEEAKAEGVYKIPDKYIDRGYFTYTSVPKIGYCWAESKGCFHYGIWNSTVKKSDLDKYGWNANPWVWVIKFERVEEGEQNGKA